MKILFIARSYPPIVGGMEKVSYELINHISKLVPTYSITNTKGKKFLPLFIPLAFIKSMYLIKKNKITHIHLCDSLLSPLGYLIKKLTKTKVTANAHGLDITYKNWLYQKIIPFSLKRLDKIITVSHYTKNECIKRGINPSKVLFIPNGINTNEFFLNTNKKKLIEKLEKNVGINLKNRKILLSVGHLVERKGYLWFIGHVMPKLGKNYIYLIIGGFGNESKGNESDVYKKRIKELELEENVFLLGKVSNKILKLAYNSADLFLMPNIKVEGDAEGFGIVIIEAGSCGLQVIASNIDGIKDAVINEKTGWLIGEKDVSGFVKKIKGKTLQKDKIREIVKNNFDWRKISKKYLNVLR